jgi:hypothetical protein
MVGLLALVVAALYSGAALYVNLVDQPARRSLETIARRSPAGRSR